MEEYYGVVIILSPSEGFVLFVTSVKTILFILHVYTFCTFIQKYIFKIYLPKCTITIKNIVIR